MITRNWRSSGKVRENKNALRFKFHRYKNVMGTPGSFGVVFKARHKETGEIVAVKRMLKDANGVPATTIREIATLKQLDHANIVRYGALIQQPAYVETDHCISLAG